jgi:hypothetical protein
MVPPTNLPEPHLIRINQLKFSSESTLNEINSLCHKAKAHHWIDNEPLWLGALFREEIHSGYIAPCEPRFINPVVGFGLFATTKIDRLAFFGQYVGLVDRKHWWNIFNSSDYSFRYPTFNWTYKKYTINSSIYCNETHYINHSSDPNLEAVAAMGPLHMHIIFRTIRPIQSGEQLFFDYGPHYWRSRNPPMPAEAMVCQ